MEEVRTGQRTLSKVRDQSKGQQIKWGTGCRSVGEMVCGKSKDSYHYNLKQMNGIQLHKLKQT